MVKMSTRRRRYFVPGFHWEKIFVKKSRILECLLVVLFHCLSVIDGQSFRKGGRMKNVFAWQFYTLIVFSCSGVMVVWRSRPARYAGLSLHGARVS